MKSAETTAILSTAFAAVAALASWASVWQTRRERVLANRPDMAIEVTQRLPSGQIFVQLHNNGGTARGVRFAVVEGNQIAYGTPKPTGIFVRGESRTIETQLTATADMTARGYVACADLAGRYLYARPTNGKQKRYRIYRWRKLSDKKLVKKYFKRDMMNATFVGHETVS